jgi:hypothetical protein
MRVKEVMGTWIHWDCCTRGVKGWCGRVYIGVSGVGRAENWLEEELAGTRERGGLKGLLKVHVKKAQTTRGAIVVAILIQLFARIYAYEKHTPQELCTYQKIADEGYITAATKVLQSVFRHARTCSGRIQIDLGRLLIQLYACNGIWSTRIYTANVVVRHPTT